MCAAMLRPIWASPACPPAAQRTQHAQRLLEFLELSIFPEAHLGQTALAPHVRKLHTTLSMLRGCLKLEV